MANQSVNQTESAGKGPEAVGEGSGSTHAMLPQSLINLIAEYGFARTDGVGEIERIHRWLLLIDDIKAYATDERADLINELREAQALASEANAQLSTMVLQNDASHAIRDAKCASGELIALQHRVRAVVAREAA